jgi:hypothetical protein
MLMRTAAIAAPVLGGLLYAWGGAVLTYAVCGVSLVLAVLLLGTVPVRYAEAMAPAGGSLWLRFGEGIHFIRTRPIILGTISLDLFAVLLGGVVALLPVYAHEVLKVGPEGLGLLRSSMTVGEVAMGLWLSARPIQRHVGRVMFAAVAIFGVANLVFALSHWFWLSMAALMLAGAADMVSVYIRSALVQFSTPDSMRGRVNAVNMLFIGSSNELGEFRAGTSAAWPSTSGDSSARSRPAKESSKIRAPTFKVSRADFNPNIAARPESVRNDAAAFPIVIKITLPLVLARASTASTIVRQPGAIAATICA